VNFRYTDWPEDHWTRFRSSARGMGHFATLSRMEKEYEASGIAREPSLHQESFHTDDSLAPLLNYSTFRLIQASRLASKRTNEPDPMVHHQIL